MSWLARLKNAQRVETGATKATKPLPVQPEGGFVAYVAPALTVQEKIEHGVMAMNGAQATATNNPDRWCWPASAAMNRLEIETFMARLSRFTDKGMSFASAEILADKLVARDREQDDRHSCFECSQLAGAGSWRCSNWQRAGLATCARNAQISTDWMKHLQRCEGFNHAIHLQQQTHSCHRKA